ncbi:ATP-binding protein [Cellulomonas sp. Marseille-Q8402]
MTVPPPVPRTTTHDWSTTVDPAHLADVRARAAGLAPGGLPHLLLEALAYPAEEAAVTGRGRCEVTLLPDGSVRVADDGRGTATVVDGDGRAVRKPVMATRDVRFFAERDAPLLPDGHPRRGMSVVAALSTWLEHTNRRAEGAWTQRYEHGVPVTDLEPVPADGSTGTAVRFLPDAVLLPAGAPVTAAAVLAWAAAWPALDVRVVDAR